MNMHPYNHKSHKLNAQRLVLSINTFNKFDARGVLTLLCLEDGVKHEGDIYNTNL